MSASHATLTAGPRLQCAIIETMASIATPGALWAVAILVGLASTPARMQAQTMPSTEGETLSGRRIVLAQAVKGHASIVIGSFAREAAKGCEEWSKAVEADPAMASVTLYQAVNLERAPGFIRGAIKSGMRKQTSAALQDRFIVLTQDDAQWRSYFAVTTEKDPYIVLIDATGQVRWHGHGAAANLEPLLKAALQ